MENLLVWILIFAGATIGLLATFLIASERQLQQAQDEEKENLERARAAQLAAYAIPRGAEIADPETKNELAREVATLQSELKTSQTTISELQEWLIHSQRRQQDLTERGERLEAELDLLRGQPHADGQTGPEGRPGELDDQHKEVIRPELSSGQHDELSCEAARLQQQLADTAAKISELENTRQEFEHANREANDANSRLRSQVDALRHQLDDTGKAQERWRQAQILLSNIVAKQAAAAQSAQEIQHELLQLTDLIVADSVARKPETAPEMQENSAIENRHEAVELTETEVFFVPAPSDGPVDQPHRPANGTGAAMASSALAITIFLVAIGILASQTWRLNPADEHALPERKSLTDSPASAAVGQPKQLLHATVNSDEPSVAKPIAE